jgi:hypothetical protein
MFGEVLSGSHVNPVTKCWHRSDSQSVTQSQVRQQKVNVWRRRQGKKEKVARRLNQRNERKELQFFLLLERKEQKIKEVFSAANDFAG